MAKDITVVFEPHDEAQGWQTDTDPMNENVQALMDAFTESRGTCTTYAASGCVAYQHKPLSSIEEREAINDSGYKIANAGTRSEQFVQVARFHAPGGNALEMVRLFNAIVEVGIERFDRIIERSLALTLCIGLWGAVAVPTFLIWMIEQKNTAHTSDIVTFVIADALLLLIRATLTVCFHIRNRHSRVQESEHEPHENL